MVLLGLEVDVVLGAWMHTISCFPTVFMQQLTPSTVLCELPKSSLNIRQVWESKGRNSMTLLLSSHLQLLGLRAYACICIGIWKANQRLPTICPPWYYCTEDRLVCTEAGLIYSDTGRHWPVKVYNNVSCSDGVVKKVFLTLYTHFTESRRVSDLYPKHIYPWLLKLWKSAATIVWGNM